MKLETTIHRIFSLTSLEQKDLYAFQNKLGEEFGELAVAVAVQQGDSSKTLDEPLVGEVADVIQCAIAVLAKATPNLTHAQRLALLDDWLDRKTQKWADQLYPNKTTSVVVIKREKQKPTRVDNLPKVFVLIRKHPSGAPQPLGERRVFKMRQVPGTRLLQVGIGKDGNQGWTLDLDKATPKFLTFRVNDDREPKTLQEAWAFWQVNRL